MTRYFMMFMRRWCSTEIESSADKVFQQNISQDREYPNRIYLKTEISRNRKNCRKKILPCGIVSTKKRSQCVLSQPRTCNGTSRAVSYNIPVHYHVRPHSLPVSPCLCRPVQLYRRRRIRYRILVGKQDEHVRLSENIDTFCLHAGRKGQWPADRKHRPKATSTKYL